MSESPDSPAGPRTGPPAPGPAWLPPGDHATGPAAYDAEPGAPEPEPAPPPPEVPEVPWRRLHPRMLLVHPVSELVRFLPVFIGLLVASTATDRGFGFQLAAVAIPIVIGLVRWWTTRYRITAERVELERGLVSRRALATPLDRVRTVDLTASPIHRLLGLSTVRIGTGSSSEDGIDLDSLTAGEARELRARLLGAASRPSAVPPAGHDGQAGAATEDRVAAPPSERVVARFSPGWLRYAPFTSAGFIALAGVVGVGFQVVDQLGLLDRFEDRSAAADLRAGSIGAVVALLLGVAVLVAVFSVIGYVIANGNFALSHTSPDGAWHLRRGLLTTRETSIDEHRLRGVSIREPAGLRVARGARLAAIVTGLDRSENGSELLLPPTPRTLVDRVAGEVVGTPAPVRAVLRPHGPRARTRRYVRALVPALVVAAGLVAAGTTVDAPLWLSVPVALVVVLLAVLVGRDRARGLGHGLVEGWLVARSGSLTRSRELLASDAVIGWNLRSTWFQRRAGLVTLVATTAGGRQAVTVLDVPEPDAVAVTDVAVPDLVGQFLEA